MKALLLWYALLFSLAGRCQPPETGWYKMLQGKIGPYAVTLHLHKIGHVYAGYYYYQTRQQPIYFQGEDTTQKGKINLVVLQPGGDSYETFLFSLRNNGAAGNWKKSEGSPQLPFSAQEAAMPLSFEYFFASGHAAFPKNTSEGPTAGFESGGVWAQGNTTEAEALRKTMGGFLKIGSGNGAPLAQLQAQKETYLKSFATELAIAKKEELEEMPSQFSRDETRRGMVAFQNNAWISLALYTYEYSGGAHGNYGTRFTTFNRQSGKKLQLADVFTAAGIKALPQLSAAAFRRQYGLKPDQKLTEGGLFQPTIPATENFYLTGRGIGFNYVPYEIGAYAMGEILIFIPFTELGSHLQPHFAATLKKM